MQITVTFVKIKSTTIQITTQQLLKKSVKIQIQQFSITTKQIEARTIKTKKEQIEKKKKIEKRKEIYLFPGDRRERTKQMR